MKTLVEGLFPKERLLAYIRDFIVFEVANDKITKKGAKYHQFFAVRLAAAQDRRDADAGADQRIGVIWHTTGSGKSLSMVFLVGILRHAPGAGRTRPSSSRWTAPTSTTSSTTSSSRRASLVGDVKHAESVDDLRELLQTEGGEVIFTTIEKFRLQDGRTSSAAPGPVRRARTSSSSPTRRTARSTASSRATPATWPRRCRTPGGSASPARRSASAAPTRSRSSAS